MARQQLLDAARVRINREPWDNTDNSRSLSGPGIGLRWGEARWRAEATLAWRGGNEASRSEPSTGQPQVWVSAAYRF